MKKLLFVLVMLILPMLAMACGGSEPVAETGPAAVAELEQVKQGPFETIPNTPPIPEDNPQTEAKVELGKMLFFEPRLSQSGIISCHSCHNLALGGTDRVATSIGHDFMTGGRNAPTVLNAAFLNSQFWDGRAETLEEQAKGPIEAGVEMAMPPDLAVNTIRQIEGYKPYFEAAFPGEADPITFDNIAKAIAAFERTLITPNDGLDRYLRGEEDALSPEALEGKQVFEQKGCVSCHSGPVLSSGLLVRFNHGTDEGRMRVTGNEGDDHVFRVAMLRNISITAPYFHDGSATTLEEAVNMMAEIQLNTELTPEEADSLLAFLSSLVGEQPRIEIPILPVD